VLTVCAGINVQLVVIAIVVVMLLMDYFCDCDQVAIGQIFVIQCFNETLLIL